MWAIMKPPLWSNGIVVKTLDSQSTGSRVQKHQVAPRLTQPFILPRSIKRVPGISGDLVEKSKLPPRSGAGLEAVEPHPYNRAVKFFFNNVLCLLTTFKCLQFINQKRFMNKKHSSVKFSNKDSMISEPSWKDSMHYASTWHFLTILSLNSDIFPSFICL